MTSYAIQAGALRENPNSGPDGVGVQADIAYTLEARAEVQAVYGTPTPANDNRRTVAAPGAPLRFLSVCSGIEAASVAWKPLGWRAVAFSEIEKFPSMVLSHHYPDVPNLGDFTKIDTTKLGRVDILCGGTPCQAFSVAGLRGSLDDARGNLSLAFVGLAHELAGHGSTAGNGLRNVVWENVVGVLSTKDNAFGCFLGGLVGADSAVVPSEKPADGKSNQHWKWRKAGRYPVLDDEGEKTGEYITVEACHVVSWPSHGMVAGPKGRAAWCVKDGQYFGVAQRRRRVLVVADFGNGADPAAVLFEPESVPRHSAPRRETGEGVAAAVAPSLTASGRGVERTGDTRGQDPVVACYAPEIARCDATREGSSQDYETTTMVAVSATGDIAHTLKGEGHDASEDGTGRGVGPAVAFAENSRAELRLEGGDGQTVGSLGGGGGKPGQGYAAIAQTVAIRGRDGGATAELGGEVATALRASQGGGDKAHVLSGTFATSAVRRLTLLECERLQGFPEVREALYIRVWKQTSSDHHQSDANAETQNRKSPKYALNADASALMCSAPNAESHSNASHLECVKHADAHALINFERNDLLLRSPRNLNWSVNIAEHLNSSLLPMPVGDFARLIAHIFTIQGKITLAGKAELPANISSSSRRLNGKSHSVRYGQENNASASDAALFMKELDAFMKSITSKAGHEIATLEQRLQTSLSFATSAISSCIPETMFPENSFSLTIEGVRGYTNIPWRGNPASPDGPRYKALGNSWAVPKFAWLGARIAALMPPIAAANDNEQKKEAA